MLRLMVLVLTVVFCGGLAGEVCGQQAVSERTRDLVAALDKTKYKKKEKKNISIELYVEIRNEPVVKANVADHGGVYEDEMGQYRLDLHVLSGGAVEGSGYDTVGVDAARVNFTLKDARIDGALLTGTKVFANGVTSSFEAVFANRTVSSGTNAASIATRETSYGLGFIQSNEQWTNRVFLVFKG